MNAKVDIQDNELADASVAGSAIIPWSADVLVGIASKAGEDAGAPEDAPSGAPGNAPKGWYSRGYLPHCDSPHLLQSITYRLNDSLPRETLRQLEDEIRTLPEQGRNAARRARIDAWLDAGLGCCALRHPEVARYVQDSVLHFHGERYHLHAWCVMPNHVHVLIQPLRNTASIVQGWKSFTARWILRNRVAFGLNIPKGEPLWMRDYWDRYIRDSNHYRMVVDYIHRNPVKAGLCQSPEAWPWSSASGSAAPGNASSGSANSGSAGVPAGIASIADEDVGAPEGSKADEDVGAPRSAGC